MAPNHAIDICYGEEGQHETFLMSNICPQKHNLNAGSWERLENTELETYARRLGEVWVIDGPIFNSQPQRLPAGVDVPSAFFKILVDEENGKPRMMAFIMPYDAQGEQPLRTFLVSVEKVESLTGLDFFTELPKEEEQKLETEVPQDLW